MIRLTLMLGLLLASGLAGCADDNPPDADSEVPQGVFLRGLVVTQAIVPIADAKVTLTPGGLAATTDEAGQFEVGPIERGTYQVAVRAFGYADTVVQASAGDQLVKVVMQAVRSDVPYIEVLKYDAYLECTFDIWVAPYQILGAPCVGVIDLVTGTDLSNDDWQFEWEVSAPGLVGILVEMVWDAQATGSQMGMLLRNVAGAGSGIDAGGTNIDIQFASTRGPSPLRMWVVQGVVNPGADDGAAFQVPQNDTMAYKVLILGRADYDQPADIHLMLENRPQVFLTKFYHALGDPSYTVLDA